MARTKKKNLEARQTAQYTLSLDVSTSKIFLQHTTNQPPPPKEEEERKGQKTRKSTRNAKGAGRNQKKSNTTRSRRNKKNKKTKKRRKQSKRETKQNKQKQKRPRWLTRRSLVITPVHVKHSKLSRHDTHSHANQRVLRAERTFPTLRVGLHLLRKQQAGA